MLEQLQSNRLSINPFSDPCVALRKACRSVTHLYDLVLSPTGLKATQFVILQAIASSGEIAQWRLADEYGVSNDTLSRRLGTLRRAGLITQRIGATRAGERLYRLTAAGAQKFQEALPYWIRAQERFRHAMEHDTNWDAVIANIDHLCTIARNAELAKCSNAKPERAKSFGAAAD